MNPRPRILFINHSGEMGGAEHSLLALARRLPVEAHVVVFSPGPLIERLREAGIAVERLEGAERLISLGAETTVATRLRGLLSLPGLLWRLVRRARASDLVYVNTKKAVLIAALAARLARRPLIWHQRDAMRRPGELTWRDGLSERLIVGLLNASACRIISVSRACADAFIAAGGQSSLPVVVHNGLDEKPSGNPSPPRSNNGLPEGAPLLGCFGRLTEGKGQADLIDALAEIPEAHLALVGSPLFGGQQIENDLRRRASALGGRIHFLGHRDDAPSLMKTMDVVVHPSSEFDSCPRVVLEALHAGRPVVATTVGGVPELIEDGVTGLLVPPKNPSSLAVAIRRLLANPEEARKLGAAGQRRAREHFALDRVVADVTREIDYCLRREQ
ncbi:MAG TPA: glycosyltransferase family 1 protein [Gammaproteobacteria bacterium]|nr:glycosyltransferase family 1 protein [Gammaproteobacteria bacterium]